MLKKQQPLDSIDNLTSSCFISFRNSWRKWFTHGA